MKALGDTHSMVAISMAYLETYFLQSCVLMSLSSITNKNIPKTFRMISDYCIYCSNYLSSSHINSIHFLIMLYISLYMTLLKKG